MSSKFESSVKHIPYAQQKVYGMLSDLSNIERVKDRLPQDKVKDLSFDSDRVSISVAPVGQVALHIVEREEPKCIKFETEKSPVAANLWIQLLPAYRRYRENCRHTGNDTIRVTLQTYGPEAAAGYYDAPQSPDRIIKMPLC